MTRYETELPNGLRFWVRNDTNDHSTAFATAVEDEYGLADEDVQNKLVFDVGAYIGSVGVTLATRGARVVCVEPVPPNAEMVRANALLNDVVVVVVEACAGLDGKQAVRWGFTADPGWNDRVADDPGLGDRHTDQRITSIAHHGFVGDTHWEAPVDQLFESAIVRSVSLQTLVTVFGRPDIIKMDCEGGEWAWLSETVARDVPLIVGEWHPYEWDGVSPHPESQTTSWNQAAFAALLQNTHDIEFTGYEGGPGGFTARKR